MQRTHLTDSKAINNKENMCRNSAIKIVTGRKSELVKAS